MSALLITKHSKWTNAVLKCNRIPLLEAIQTQKDC